MKHGTHAYTPSTDRTDILRGLSPLSSAAALRLRQSDIEADMISFGVLLVVVCCFGSVWW